MGIEKIDSKNIKITKTVIEETVLNIGQLKEAKTNYENAITETQFQCDQKKIRLQAELDSINQQILEAKNLGVE